jgi:hypothetical protein
MRALLTISIYLGSFLAIGLIARWWMMRRSIDLGGIRAQLGPSRKNRQRFLLGIWRDQDPDL